VSPRNAGKQDETKDGGESVYLRLAVHVAEETARLRVGDPSLHVHPHAAHGPQVKPQPTVSYGQSSNVMSSALDTEQEVVFPCVCAQAITSAPPRQRATSAGGLSIMPFQAVRDSS
jgi:hypothetical protein